MTFDEWWASTGYTNGPNASPKSYAREAWNAGRASYETTCPFGDPDDYCAAHHNDLTEPERKLHESR